MSPFETATVTAAYQQRCDDRVAVWDVDERVVIVVADGAGGIGDGDQAAETVLREIKAACESAATSEAWAGVLAQLDFRIASGESTAVVVDVSPQGICGASVGDSQAWIIANGELANLTVGQVRKPLLGSGKAKPIGFTAAALEGILLVATDGFCNYVQRPALLRALPQFWFPEMPRKLLESVRLKSGDLWDDVGIVTCRKRPKTRPRQRYTL